MKLRNKIFTLIGLVSFTFFIACNDTTEPPDDNNNNNGYSPSIISVMPTTTYPGYTVEVSGDRFGFEQGTGFVSINGKKVSEYVYWSENSIELVIPDDATSGKVVVTVGEKSSNSVNITINEPSSGDPPEINAFDTDKPSPRTAVGIEGSNFGDERGSNFVTFNGIAAEEYTSWRDKKIVAIIPTGATSGDVIVYVDGLKSNAMNLVIKEESFLLEQVLISAGTLIMGAEGDPFEDYTPAHEVTISKSFYMSIYEITQGDWEKFGYVIPEHNSYNKGVNNPVERVSWMNACNFCNALSDRENFKPVYTINESNVTADWEANGYRLPTEAEWELAARAGSDDWSYGKGADGSKGNVNGMAWCVENAENSTHPVGQKEPNYFGLYDMLGNVMEWCWDWYSPDYYDEQGNNLDPKGPAMDVMQRSLRGGSYNNGKNETTCYHRYSSQHETGSEYYIGFRVVRNAK
ncbi:SUMF1/EgtB/PvdO family nonheme iron enzyme [Bacteroidota bacterium]